MNYQFLKNLINFFIFANYSVLIICFCNVKTFFNVFKINFYICYVNFIIIFSVMFANNDLLLFSTLINSIILMNFYEIYYLLDNSHDQYYPHLYTISTKE
jgi:hypothetical protein